MSPSEGVEFWFGVPRKNLMILGLLFAAGGLCGLPTAAAGNPFSSIGRANLGDLSEVLSHPEVCPVDGVLASKSLSHCLAQLAITQWNLVSRLDAGQCNDSDKLTLQWGQLVKVLPASPRGVLEVPGVTLPAYRGAQGGQSVDLGQLDLELEKIEIVQPNGDRDRVALDSEKENLIIVTQPNVTGGSGNEPVPPGVYLHVSAKEEDWKNLRRDALRGPEGAEKELGPVKLDIGPLVLAAADHGRNVKVNTAVGGRQEQVEVGIEKSGDEVAGQVRMAAGSPEKIRTAFGVKAGSDENRVTIELAQSNLSVRAEGSPENQKIRAGWKSSDGQLALSGALEKNGDTEVAKVEFQRRLGGNKKGPLMRVKLKGGAEGPAAVELQLDVPLAK